MVVGGRIRSVDRAACRLRPIAVAPGLAAFRRRAVGSRVEGVGRIGKRAVMHLSSGSAIVFEPRMTGLVLVADPPNVEHLRLKIGLAGCGAREVLYWDRRGLGSVRLLTSAELAARFGLGPDALEMTAERWRERIGRSARAIKVALLDQRAAAGIGNLYASEILHLAGIDPRRPCRDLTRAHWSKIDASTREVLAEAIRLEGSTLSDGTYRNALNQEGGYQNRHRVYDRERQACPSCGRGRIARIVQAQRATFYCPRCQK